MIIFTSSLPVAMYTGTLKVLAKTPIWRDPSLFRIPPVSATASAPIITRFTRLIKYPTLESGINVVWIPFAWSSLATATLIRYYQNSKYPSRSKPPAVTSTVSRFRLLQVMRMSLTTRETPWVRIVYSIIGWTKSDHAISDRLFSIICYELTLVKGQFLKRSGTFPNALNTLLEVFLVNSSCHSLDIDITSTLKTEFSDSSPSSFCFRVGF